MGSSFLPRGVECDWMTSERSFISIRIKHAHIFLVVTRESRPQGRNVTHYTEPRAAAVNEYLLS